MPRTTEPDPRLEDVQQRVDEIRRHLSSTPGMVVREHDTSPLFDEDERVEDTTEEEDHRGGQ